MENQKYFDGNKTNQQVYIEYWYKNYSLNNTKPISATLMDYITKYNVRWMYLYKEKQEIGKKLFSILGVYNFPFSQPWWNGNYPKFLCSLGLSRKSL